MKYISWKWVCLNIGPKVDAWENHFRWTWEWQVWRLKFGWLQELSKPKHQEAAGMGEIWVSQTGIVISVPFHYIIFKIAQLLDFGQLWSNSVAYHHEVGLLVYPCHQKSSCRFRSRSQYLISIQWFCPYHFRSNKPWWYYWTAILAILIFIINLYHHDFVHFWWSKWFYQFISVHIPSNFTEGPGFILMMASMKSWTCHQWSDGMVGSHF